MAYKINIRGPAAWENILKDTNVEITDSNGYFTSGTLEGVLDELYTKTVSGMPWSIISTDTTLTKNNGYMVNTAAVSGDSIDREEQSLYYGVFESGEYISNASIVGTETVVSKEGTSTVTVSAGRITFGTGTAWDLVLSNGSIYPHPTKTSSTTAVWYDTSGNGLHGTVTLNGTSPVSDINTHCGSGPTSGSDWLNQKGYTIIEIEDDPSFPYTLPFEVA